MVKNILKFILAGIFFGEGDFPSAFTTYRNTNSIVPGLSVQYRVFERKWGLAEVVGWFKKKMHTLPVTRRIQQHLIKDLTVQYT